MLTKDLVGKLSPEQQEILAQMEFRKVQRRLKLLELARGKDWRSRYFPIYIFVVFLSLITIYSFNFFHVQGKPAVVFLPLGVMFVFTLFAYVARINRRLDALLDLLDFDREHPESRNHSYDENSG